MSAERLQAIQEEIESLTREALTLVPAHEKNGARSYWHNQILAAIGGCGYESMCSLSDSINVTREEEEEIEEYKHLAESIRTDTSQ